MPRRYATAATRCNPVGRTRPTDGPAQTRRGMVPPPGAPLYGRPRSVSLPHSHGRLAQPVSMCPERRRRSGRSGAAVVLPVRGGYRAARKVRAADADCSAASAAILAASAALLAMRDCPHGNTEPQRANKNESTREGDEPSIQRELPSLVVAARSCRLLPGWCGFVDRDTWEKVVDYD